MPVPPHHRLLQSIAESSRDAVLIAEASQNPGNDLTIGFANDAFVRLVGCARDELSGHSLSVLTRWSVDQTALAPLWQAVAAGQTVEFVWDCCTAHGRTLRTELTATPLTDDARPPAYVVALRALPGSQHTTPTKNVDSRKMLLAVLAPLLDGVQLPAIVLDTRGVLLAANELSHDLCRRFFGHRLPLLEPFAQPETDIGEAIGQSAFFSGFEAACQGEHVRRTAEVPWPAGSSVWFDASYTPVLDETGCVCLVLVMAEDVTHAKQLEAALALSQQRYTIATQHANAGIWDWNLVSGEFYLDPNVKAILGYSNTEIPNNLERWSEQIFPPDRPAVARAIDSHLQGDTDEYRIEHRMVHKDGSLRWMLSIGKAVRDTAGTAVRFVGTDIDITQRKKTEAALQASEERLRAIWNVAPDAMIVSDAAATIRMANPAFFALTGCASDEVIGTPLHELFVEDSRAAVLAAVTQAHQGNHPTGGVEAAISCTDGSRKKLVVVTELIRLDDGSQTWLSVLHDVTAARAAEAALRHHSRNLEALTGYAHVLFRPARSADERADRLHDALKTLAQRARLAYVALCQRQPQKADSKNRLCLQIADTDSHPHDIPQPSPRILQTLHDGGWAVAPAAEVVNGHTGPSEWSYLFGPVVAENDLWGYLVFGKETTSWRNDDGTTWFAQATAEMLGTVLQRWEAQAVLVAARDELEQQVTQRTTMLLHVVKSLQHQIDERRRAEMVVRRRLEVERTLSRIGGRLVSAHLVGDDNFNAAIQATLSDIGHQVQADAVLLWEMSPDGRHFGLRDSWAEVSSAVPSMEKVARSDLADLLAHLRENEHLLISSPTDALSPMKVELDRFRSLFTRSLLILPLYVDEEPAGLLACCDANWLADSGDEAVKFVHDAATVLNGMLRIERVMKSLETRVAEQTHQLAVFFNMTVLGSTSDNLPATLASALAMLKDVGRCDAVAVHFVSGENHSLHLAHQVGLTHVDHRHLLTIAPDTSFGERIQLDRRTVLVTDPSEIPQEVKIPKLGAYLGVPMVVHGTLQGLLSCYWKSASRVSLHQMSLLTALADQLGVLLENQRLHRKTQEMAVVSERQRLARELHDLVAQSLYSMMLFTRASREAAEDDDRARLIENLEEVEAAALRSMREMRLLLYQLRPLELEGKGLVDALLTRLDLVERRLNLEVDVHLPPLRGIPTNVEDTLYYVAIEALNNSLKHANATRLTIRLFHNREVLELFIRDNGAGFDASQPSYGMGLSNMRERMQAIKGELELQSAPAGGTQIWARVGADVLGEESTSPRGDNLQ